MNSGKLVLGVLAGVAVGAIAGILLAPEKGSKTRKRLLSRGKEYVDGAHEKFDQTLSAIAGKEERTWNEAGELTANGKNKNADPKQEIKNTVL